MATAIAVDLALVLAVDCSSSVDAGDFKLQMDGIAAAVRNPQIHEAIAAGTFRAIALTLVQWSTWQSQDVTISWRILAGQSDLEAFARETESAERRWLPGGTGLASAMAFCTGLLEQTPVLAERRVIDVSGDGEDNDGGDVGMARDDAVTRGITINGLPIVGGSASLVSYYNNQVIGGPGAFLVPATNMFSFKDAMTQKLLREVGNFSA